MTLVAVVATASAVSAQVQETQATAGGSLLLSLQPVDDFYVGGPYLNEGIGGLGPGMALTFNVVTPPGLVIAGEFSTAWFEVEQGGRLVPGACRVPTPDCSYVGGSGTTRLHDSMLSGLVGVSRGQHRTRVHFLGGISWILKGPTVDGVELLLDRDAHDRRFARSSRPVVGTGGFDVTHGLTGRLSFAGGARYSYVRRNEQLRYLGIGNHLLRFGAGLRVRLN